MVRSVFRYSNLKILIGTVRQYRLFRAHVNFGTDSLLYPYDTQKPFLKLQSLDHGDDSIKITTRTLNNLNGWVRSDSDLTVGTRCDYYLLAQLSRQLFRTSVHNVHCLPDANTLSTTPDV